MPAHVMLIAGTRPEAIKMMPVLKALKSRPDAFKTTFVVTGQHREMLRQVFVDFRESPDVDLDVMSHDQTLPGLTARIITEFSNLLREVRPDILLVHGDTTTAMAAALSGFYSGIRLGHVEAGLRSFDLSRPWPEEFNRVMVDTVCEFLFAPTASARDNLLREYNRRGQIYVTGNTGIDALLQAAGILDRNEKLSASLAETYRFLDPGRRLIVVTGHRRESFGEGFERICEGLRLVASRPDVQVLYPVHLNPNVGNVVRNRLARNPNVFLRPPVAYMDMVYLMRRASVLITDSGGLQEEGPALGKPVLVMRDVTERPEAIETGAVRLIGTDPTLMQSAVSELLDDARAYARASQPVFPYGDGTAAQQIADILAREVL